MHGARVRPRWVDQAVLPRLGEQEWRAGRHRAGGGGGALRERAHLFRRSAARKTCHDRQHTDDRTVFANTTTLLNSDPERPPITFRVGGDMPFHSQ